MSYTDYISMAKGIDFSTMSGLKDYTKRLMNSGVNDFNLYYNIDLDIALGELGLSRYKIKDIMRMIDDAKNLIEKYGDVASEYIAVFDKCRELHLDHHYFDSCGSSSHNSFVLQMGNDTLRSYPTLYSISTFDGQYNCTILIENYRNYSEKFVHLKDFGAVGIKMITKLLKEKVDAELAYRQDNAWKGELDFNAIVAEVQPMFPKLNIKVSVGKRQCDGDVEPYKAIVVYDGNSYVGSITLGYNSYKGVMQMSCRVPLCGESGCDVNNDNLIDNIVKSINFMIS